ncbi:MAG: alpha/beta hydrolase [Afipia sp.]|nr:alpha/beta hydrolase [Afipia sp.]
MIVFRKFVFAIGLTVFAAASVAFAQDKSAIQTRVTDVNGIKMSYLVAGKGDPIVLLHGFGETSHMWRPLIEQLAKNHEVIAPDLRGFGNTSTPDSGYTKKEMAQDVHALVKSLGYPKIRLVGHDIGLMVAYAYAAQYPNEVERLVLMEAFLPGVGEWNNVFLLRDLWHFHFFGKTPLALVTGRERIYLEHFWNDFAADGTKSVSEADRKLYAGEYAKPGHMKAGMEVFKAFPTDAKDFADFAKAKLQMPLLVLSGEKAGGPFLIEQGKMVANNVEGVLVPASGHWLMEEAPDQVIPKLVEFLNK